MAYEIDHRPEAHYHLFQFEGENDLLERLNHQLKIMDGVLRFRIIRLKPGAPDAAAAARLHAARAPRGARARGPGRRAGRRRRSAGGRRARRARRRRRRRGRGDPGAGPAVEPLEPPAAEEAPAEEAPVAEEPPPAAEEAARGGRSPGSGRSGAGRAAAVAQPSNLGRYGKDLGARHRDEGHRRQRGAPREGPSEAGSGHQAPPAHPAAGPEPATAPRRSRPPRSRCRSPRRRCPPGHVRKKATGELGKIRAVDPRAGTATVFWLRRGAASTVPLSAISRR